MIAAASSPGTVQRQIRSCRRGGVALLTLNRPEAHNALNDALLSALLSEARALRGDAAVRVVILTGTGRSFCSGDDLKAAAAATRAEFAHTIELLQDLTTALLDLDKPLVAALNGGAFGAGLEIALNCDIRIATDDFVCATPEARLGLTPTNGASVLLPLLIGPARARRMLLGGARFDARWCLEAGLVDELVPADALLPRALAIAEELATGAPGALAATRRLLNAPLRNAMTAALRDEIAECLALHPGEGLEGLHAFLTGRAPRWQSDAATGSPHAS